jgi:hypothetical protein
MPPVDEELGTVANEFASVAVSIDHDGNSPRLLLTDLRSGAARHVDALELESLIWAPDEWWRRILDPSLHRWSDPGAGPGVEAIDP